jgi:hypothetical protein
MNSYSSQFINPISILSILLISQQSFAVRGGTPVPAGKMAAIGYFDPAPCSGTFINSNTILTVNHCFPNGSTAGQEFRYNTGDGFITLEVTDVESFAEDFPHEIAIARVKGQLPKIKFPPLAQSLPTANGTALLAGYGFDGTESRGKLLKADVGIKLVGNIGGATGGTMAVVVPLTPKGPVPCQGDSGGPIFIGGKLSALTSFAISPDPSFNLYDPITQCNKVEISYHIPVSPYLGWIAKAVQTLDQREKEKASAEFKPSPGKEKVLQTCGQYQITQRADGAKRVRKGEYVQAFLKDGPTRSETATFEIVWKANPNALGGAVLFPKNARMPAINCELQ